MKARTKIIAAAAGAAAAAAGYYFFGSKSAKNNRQKATKWATSLKNDVIKQLKGLEMLNRATVNAVIEKAANAYKDVRSIDGNDVAMAVAELKKNWELLSKEAMKAGKGVVKKAKKAIRAK